MTRKRLRVSGYWFLVTVLALSLTGCQFSSNIAPPPQPETSLPTGQAGNQQPATPSPHPQSGLPRRPISLQDDSGDSIEILAEIADEPEAQARGLMFRESLPPGEGMLFIFPEEIPLGFWMKNTLIPLDILFFDASGDWVSGVTMTPCEGDPCPGYPSQNPAKYALEIPAGSIEEWGVGEGWKLDLP